MDTDLILLKSQAWDKVVEIINKDMSYDFIMSLRLSADSVMRNSGALTRATHRLVIVPPACRRASYLCRSWLRPLIY